MSQPIYVTVASGGSASGAFTLEEAQRPVAVLVPSLSAAAEVHVEFTTVSGTAPWHPLQTLAGDGTRHVVAGSGPSVGLVPIAPTPWGRFTLTGSQSDVRTFTLLPGPR